MLRSIVASRVVILVLALALSPKIASAWTLLGTIGDEISSPEEVFIDDNTIEDMAEEKILAQTLHVYRHKIAGIDFFDEERGYIYDTRFLHRSYVRTAVYDCTRRMTATIRIVYYSGQRPASDDTVYELREEPPVFYGQVPGIPSATEVLDFICSLNEPQNPDLLSGNPGDRGQGG